MKKLELKHLAGYLPYGLKCQYTGIINGSEISAHKKDFEKENTPYTNWEYFEPLNAIEGLKIGLLKEIHVFKNYWTCRIGIKHTGLKTFYNGSSFKPILRPLSDLTKEIEVNGVKFIPADIINKDFFWDYVRNNMRALVKDESYILVGCLPALVVDKLLEWHFDIYGLIEKGLAIDINKI